MTADEFTDHPGRYALRLSNHRSDHLLQQIQIHRTRHELRPGPEGDNCRLYLPHIAFDMPGKIINMLFREMQLMKLDLISDNPHPGRQIRGLNGRHQPGSHSGSEFSINTNEITRVGVCRQNNPLTRLYQVIQNFVEFLLRLLLPGQRMDIFHQKDVAIVMIFSFETVHGICLYVPDHLLGKLLGSNILQTGHRRQRKDLVGHCLGQMTFAKSRTAVDIETRADGIIIDGY